MWNKDHYDKWLDIDVGFARHALSINETRADFPRVEWATEKEAAKNKDKTPKWLKQVWFAGCNSDVGGSYLEPESRLSDIALDWMVKELRICFSNVQIQDNLLIRSPNPFGLQLEEEYLFKFWILKRRWPQGPRAIEDVFPLHPSVLERLAAKAVPQMGEVKAYRPPQLASHRQAKKYYHDDTVDPGSMTTS